VRPTRGGLGAYFEDTLSKAWAENDFSHGFFLVIPGGYEMGIWLFQRVPDLISQKLMIVLNCGKNKTKFKLISNYLKFNILPPTFVYV
jgi:hypothetical protein